MQFFLKLKKQIFLGIPVIRNVQWVDANTLDVIFDTETNGPKQYGYQLFPCTNYLERNDIFSKNGNFFITDCLFKFGKFSFVLMNHFQKLKHE